MLYIHKRSRVPVDAIYCSGDNNEEINKYIRANVKYIKNAEPILTDMYLVNLMSEFVVMDKEKFNEEFEPTEDKTFNRICAFECTSQKKQDKKRYKVVMVDYNSPYYDIKDYDYYDKKKTVLMSNNHRIIITHQRMKYPSDKMDICSYRDVRNGDVFFVKDDNICDKISFKEFIEFYKLEDSEVCSMIIPYVCQAILKQKNYQIYDMCVVHDFNFDELETFLNQKLPGAKLEHIDEFNVLLDYNCSLHSVSNNFVILAKDEEMFFCGPVSRYIKFLNHF